MIKFETDQSHVHCECSGTLREICADTCVFIKSMYDSILNNDNDDLDKEKVKEIADDYKNFVTNDMPNLVFMSREEVDRKLQEAMKSLSDFLEHLKEVFKDDEEDEEESGDKE